MSTRPTPIAKDSGDIVTLYVTSGSNGKGSKLPIANCWLDEKGVLHVQPFKVLGAVYEL